MPRPVVVPLVFLAALGCKNADPAPTCEQAATDALQQCLADAGAGLADCHLADGMPCAADPKALDALRGAVGESCGDGELAGLAVDAAAERLAATCGSQSEALAWRFYGGPQAAVWTEASERSCLSEGHLRAAQLLDETVGAVGECLDVGCSADELGATRADLASRAAADIARGCMDIGALVSLDATTLTERVEEQADCTVAAVRSGTADVGVRCGPEFVDFDAPRGEWTEVVLDSAEWGTLCGDGSDFAFWIRPAPEGHPLDRVFIGLEGGGVCLFEQDCGPKLESAPELFTALDGRPTGTGIASLEPGVSPFEHWTHVFVPYCNQDVFAGGGVVEDLGNVQLPRHGSVNLRTTLRLVRDRVWHGVDAEGREGFRPDRLTAVFGGWSAGAYGTLYNFPFLLDELQWPRSIAFPDAGLALHNGEVLGVGNLGLVKIPAWNMRPYLPPYCFGPECAEGPVLLEAASPRLLQVPEQQVLVLTNPRDQIQQGDAFFSTEDHWINTLRQEVCATRDLPGVQYYLTSISDESVHVVSIRDELWTASVDGVAMRDWFRRAVEEPGSVTDRMEEGNFVADVPGVEPFPCPVAP